ncbi:MAG: hypothetical protein ACI4XN_14310 [Candidatus Kurthia intestinigallinarum]
MARPAGKKNTSTKKTTVDDKKYLCPFCMKEKKKSEFYMSSDPKVLTGITSICKDCTKKIALAWDDNRQEFGVCTKKSVMEALEYIDKPFLNNLWDSSYAEWANQESQLKRTTIWDAYIKNVGMVQYRGMRWRDGDIFQTYVEDAKQVAALENGNKEAAQTLIDSQEVSNEFEKNRRDVIRLLGYDPFEGEKLEDQPLLYSQMLGYLDNGGDSNDDMMRTSSAITIVRGFSQQSKIDDKIAKAMANSNVNASELKTLLDAKKNLSSTISQLAEQSCLSLKHNKNASKGENTWTGKIKKLKDIDLRDAEVNGFDIGTCRGMQQVLEISDASILKQLALDESEWSDMVAEQRKTIIDLQIQRDTYREVNRILLRENLDLRDTLEENDLLDVKNLYDLKELFSPLSETVVQDSEEDDDAEE